MYKNKAGPLLGDPAFCDCLPKQAMQCKHNIILTVIHTDVLFTHQIETVSDFKLSLYRFLCSAYIHNHSMLTVPQSISTSQSYNALPDSK